MRLRRAPETVWVFASTLLLLGLAPILGGCPDSSASSRDGSATPVVLDGSLDEWGDAAFRADGHDLLVRLDLPEEVALQAAPYSIAVLLDMDADPDTGSGLDDVTGGPDVGAELAIVFSPSKARSGVRGRIEKGVAVLLPGPGASGNLSRRAPHGDFDVVFAPTYAASDFELRMSRRPREHPEVAAALASGRAAAHLVSIGTDASVLWSRSLGTVDLPPLAPDSVRVPSVLPPKEDDVVRIVSWNVLFASPQKKPEPFARILRALAPDIVLLQEWERSDVSDIVAWFDENLEPGWHGLDSEGWGVAVLARAPLTPLPSVHRKEATGDSPAEDLRMAAGVAETRLGRVVVASLHLKCCGGRDGPEERARVAEARAVRETIRVAAAASAGDARGVHVIGGDLNLVGSEAPLLVLQDGVGPQGEDLAIADAGVVGDAARYTWRGTGSRYSPGRLDYLLYGGGEAAQAFAVDSARLSGDVLRDVGIQRRDSEASDHLPLVLDVRPFSKSFVTGPG